MIFGYCREAEDAVEYYVPDAVYILCVRYFHFSHFIIYLSEDRLLNPNGIYLADLEHETNGLNGDIALKDDCTPHHKPCSVRDLEGYLNRTRKPFNHGGYWTIYDSGLCYAANIEIASGIHWVVAKQSRSKEVDSSTSMTPGISNNYHVVFKCGGMRYRSYLRTDYCCGLVLNSMALDTVTSLNSATSDTQDWASWELPKLPHKVCGNTLLFGARSKTLYSIGGDETNKVFALHFGDGNINGVDWEWQELPAMQWNRYSPSCTMITDPVDGTHKLLVIGGRTRGQDQLQRQMDKYPVEIFDFEGNQWSEFGTKAPFSCPDLYRAGIYLDEKAQRIYVGGGQMDIASKRMHYLDLKQMEWEYLPNTNLAHNFSPILWKDHNEILYISSTNGNRIEWLDLRQHEHDLRVQDEVGGGVDINFTKKWGFVTRDGNVEYEEAKQYALDKQSTLSHALNTVFPKDCCVARLLSANDFS